MIRLIWYLLTFNRHELLLLFPDCVKLINKGVVGSMPDINVLSKDLFRFENRLVPTQSPTLHRARIYKSCIPKILCLSSDFCCWRAWLIGWLQWPIFLLEVAIRCFFVCSRVWLVILVHWLVPLMIACLWLVVWSVKNAGCMTECRCWLDSFWRWKPLSGLVGFWRW